MIRVTDDMSTELTCKYCNKTSVQSGTSLIQCDHDGDEIVFRCTPPCDEYLRSTETRTVGARIVCAANRWPDGIVLPSVRHHDMLMNNTLKVLRGHGHAIGPAEQGFVDQFGNFYTREAAWVIAEAKGQIRYRCGGDEHGRLYSENLY